MKHDFDLTIIGAGPGGYVAAIRAAQLGLKTLLIEKDKPGGVCLNLGCIPSKSLIHQADLLRHVDELRELGVSLDLSGLDYGKAFAKSRQAADRLSKGVQFLVKKNNITYKRGTARLLAPDLVEIDSEEKISTKTVILATGSRPKALPGVPFDERRILSSNGALMLEKLPKRIAVLGAGAIGMELAYVWSAFGAEIHIIEAQPRVLPLEDAEAAAVVARSFAANKIDIRTGASVSQVNLFDEHVSLGIQPGSPEKLEVDALLVAIGREPNSSDLGLEELGVRLIRGFVQTGHYGETAAAGVYAIGDLSGDSPLLAHVASKEGELAVEHIAHRLTGSARPEHSDVARDLIPSAVYCSPELASFGLSAEQAQMQGVSHKTFSFPYRAIGKAVATMQTEGFVKILADPATEEILGASIVGERATDIIHELILARQAELTVSELADMMHAHPTISEGIMEAAKGLKDKAIHI